LDSGLEPQEPWGLLTAREEQGSPEIHHAPGRTALSYDIANTSIWPCDCGLWFAEGWAYDAMIVPVQLLAVYDGNQQELPYFL